MHNNNNNIQLETITIKTNKARVVKKVRVLVEAGLLEG